MVLLRVGAATPSPTGHVPAEPVAWGLAWSCLTIGLPVRLDFLETTRSVATESGFAALILIAARAIFTDRPYAAAETVRHWLLAVTLLLVGRAAVLAVERRRRRRGEGGLATLIIGTGPHSRLAAQRLLHEPELGLRPVAFMADEQLDDQPRLGLPVLTLGPDFDRVVTSRGIGHVVLGFTNIPHDDLIALARRCWRLGISVSVIPRLFELSGQQIEMEHLGALALTRLDLTQPGGWKFRVKYALDRVFAVIALVALAPLLAVAAMGVRLSLGHPVIFRQWRVGRDGRGFEMLKFRTLRDRAGREADAAWARAQLSLDAAPEADVTEQPATRFARFLRATSIDELPQLWNVLRGEMSLIGPRPERLTYVEQFADQIYGYRDRHRVKSGLTGWAQIHGLRGATPLAERIEWDNLYIENWSFWLDFKIALRTVPAVLTGRRRQPGPAGPLGPVALTPPPAAAPSGRRRQLPDPRPAPQERRAKQERRGRRTDRRR
jgi:exopolysaccharide biosynthesis polyprenyl glycosylphosphotransferase